MWLCPQFNDILNVFFSSPVIVALIVAIVLDNTLTRHVTKKDRGMLWTRKFRVFHHDPRNLEFYRLPMGLHKFFPPTWFWTTLEVIYTYTSTKNLFECAICALRRSEQPQLPVDGSGRDSHVTQHCWRKDWGRTCQFVHTRTSFCNLRWRRNLRADLIPAAHAFLFRFDKPKGQRTNKSCICPVHQDRSAGSWICIWDSKQGIFVAPFSFPFGACKLMHFCQIHVYREYQSSVSVVRRACSAPSWKGFCLYSLKQFIKKSGSQQFWAPHVLSFVGQEAWLICTAKSGWFPPCIIMLFWLLFHFYELQSGFLSFICWNLIGRCPGWCDQRCAISLLHVCKLQSTRPSFRYSSLALACQKPGWCYQSVCWPWLLIVDCWWTSMHMLYDRLSMSMVDLNR